MANGLHAVCFGCRSVVRRAELDRGWVRHFHDDGDERVWFLCAVCLERGPYLLWSDEGPSIARFAFHGDRPRGGLMRFGEGPR